MATRQSVRRFAQIVKLKPQYLDEYKAVHARVWPDVLKQIKDCNIEDCMTSSPGYAIPPEILNSFLLLFPDQPELSDLTLSQIASSTTAQRRSSLRRSSTPAQTTQEI